jgi:hypothetical protein
MASFGIRLTRVMPPFEAHMLGITFATMFLLIEMMALLHDSPSRGRAVV